MAVKIRLTRLGAKKRPTYRVVVSETLGPRDGKFIDILGHYNPGEDDLLKNAREEKILYWLNNGATPTETVRSLFKKAGILQKWQEEKQEKSLDAKLKAKEKEKQEKKVKKKPKTSSDTSSKAAAKKE